MILVITPHPSERLKYILNFIMQCYPNVSIKTLELAAYSKAKSDEIIIEYNSESTLQNAIYINCKSFIYETEVRPIKDQWNSNTDCLMEFVHHSPLGFDVFSAIFHQLSRYEEYASSKLDKFGRFNSQSSCIVKENQHQTPWVDVYVKQFLSLVQKQHSTFIFTPTNFTYKPTMDVDIAYEYLGRNVKRTIGGFARNLLNPKGLLERIKVLLHLQKDPSFIFNQLDKTDLLYFIHVGDYGPLDKSCGLSKKEFQAFLQSQNIENIGLHPSFQSHLDLDELLFETQQLEEIADTSISQSRQHFIKLILPETYELLQQIGISKEYSMGWPDICGFRAGTTHPHYFFNVQTNQQTELQLVPFSWMDAHFIYHTKINEMAEQFYRLKEHYKTYGGYFTPIFHNNHFSKPQFGETLYQLLNEV